MTQRTFDFRKAFLATLILFFLSGSSWALKPEFDSLRRIMLRVEHPHDGLRVCYTAVVLGAEMWWWRYNAHIVKYCTPNSPPFYATLPGYGYTLVTATKLANMLFYDKELARRGYTTTLRDKLVTAMQNDRRYGAQKQVGDYWDPINDWKWRSVYMEARLSNLDLFFGGNCFGTADYMTKGWEWVWGYSENWDIFDSLFPCVYLDGSGQGSDYYLDRELKRSEFGYADQILSIGTLVGYYLNCFDVIRLAMRREPQETDLIITTANNTQLNLGTIAHAEAYLCSDRAGKAWMFHKLNHEKPFSMRAVDLTGFDMGYPLSTTIYALFYHKYTAKGVMTNIWEVNWAHVWPVQ